MVTFHEAREIVSTHLGVAVDTEGAQDERDYSVFIQYDDPKDVPVDDTLHLVDRVTGAYHRGLVMNDFDRFLKMEIINDDA